MDCSLRSSSSRYEFRHSTDAMFFLQPVEERQTLVDLLLPFRAIGEALSGGLKLIVYIIEFDERRVEAGKQSLSLRMIGGYVGERRLSLSQTRERRLTAVVVHHGRGLGKSFTHGLGMREQLQFLLQRLLLAIYEAGLGEFVELELAEVLLLPVLCFGSHKFLQLSLEGGIGTVSITITLPCGVVSKGIEKLEAESALGEEKILVL